RCHIGMLCVWDMMLLFCCLITYGVISLYYKIIPFVGIVAYILYIFQPFASFCVTGTIWQVAAITIERYMAVSHPLQQRTRKARFSVRWICAAIATCAFILNMTAVPFERHLKKCYEFLNDGQITIRTMIVQQDVVNNQYYAILVHLIPDLIFRTPSPIILIATLTVRTLQICRKRRVGSNTIYVHSSRNVPLMLTLLSVKFILCNTLYMFNTILMEVMGYGGGNSSQQTDDETEQYIRTLYLTDFSNMLLALHSATNWLLFYHWRNCNKNDSQRQESVFNSAFKSIIDPHDADDLFIRFSSRKQKIGTEIIARLCMESPELAGIFVPNLNEVKKESFRDVASVQLRGKIVGDFIEQTLHTLAYNSGSLSDLREKCRRIGVAHYHSKVHLTAVHWKIARDVLLSYAVDPHNKWATQEVFTPS
uniref:G-protein coupled receptors family 1 profile domain-containing protein n=1 Tax=Parascaris univalens TaxID=6257 RepID=A0A914ZNQ3_PARUN